MKISKLVFGLFALVFCLCGQTVDDYLREGRALLVAKNYLGARARFSAALNKEPSHERARFLRAVSSLMMIKDREDVGLLLSQLSFSLSGRDVFDWNSRMAFDVEGLPLIDTSLDVDGVLKAIRNGVIRDFDPIIADLESIKTRSFNLTLSKSETTVADISVDLADCRLMVAILHGSQAVVNLVSDWLGGGITWSEIRAAIVSDEKTIENILGRFPRFLGDTVFITRSESKEALVLACRAYLEASEMIRSRAANQPYLFSFSTGDNGSESRFYSNVAAILSSLESSVHIPLVGSMPVFIGPIFHDDFKLRDLLPRFSRNSIVVGSWPDLGFHGVVGDVREYQVINGVRKILAKGSLNSYQSGLLVSQITSGPLNKIGFGQRFSAHDGFVYGVEFSTNLNVWSNPILLAGNNKIIDLDSIVGVSVGNRFVRLVDVSKRVVAFGVIRDAKTGAPIPFANIVFVSNGVRVFSNSDVGGYYVIDWGREYPRYFGGEMIVDGFGYVRNKQVINNFQTGALMRDVVLTR